MNHEANPSDVKAEIDTELEEVSDKTAVAGAEPEQETNGSIKTDHRDEKRESEKETSVADVVVTQQPTAVPVCPPGLESLLECGQLMINKDNLRHEEAINENALNRMEVVEETRKILFFVEQEPVTSQAGYFMYKLYNHDKQPIIEVYSRQCKTCFCCGASWNCCGCCGYRAMIFSPPGQLAGFVEQSRTRFVQEFCILDPDEQVILVLRGGPYDLEIYSPDFEHELGRLAIHGWHAVMHEIRRSRQDVGITFPLDLDVRFKAVLLGSTIAIDWLYATKGGRR